MKVWEKLSKLMKTLVMLGCVVLLAIVGLSAWLLWPRTAPSVQGQWSGTITVSSPGVADQSDQATASLTQTGQTIAGTLTTDQTSAVTGVIQGNTVTLSTNTEVALILELAGQHLSGTTTLQESGQSKMIAIDLSRTSTTPSPSPAPRPMPVSATANSSQPVAPAQPATPAPAPQAQPGPIILGISSLTQTNGVAFAPPNDPNSVYGTDMLQDQPTMGADGQWSEAPVNGPARFAEWSFTSAGGLYQLVATYAAAQPRPLELSLNGAVVIPSAFSAVTGGWNPENRMDLPLERF